MTIGIVGIVTLVGAISIALIAWAVATRRPPAAIEEVRPGIYRTRRNYFFALSTVLIVALLATLQLMPYPSAGDDPPEMTLVADGMTWAWMFRSGETPLTGPDEVVVPVGRPVRFDVGALDVNHAFGVYSPDGALIGQVQAMPGYRNLLTLTFPTPGTYSVLCLEYCGIGHHFMIASIEAR